jgi:hypothetical protein
MNGAAAHTHGAAATEVRATATPTAEVTATATATAEVTAPAATAEVTAPAAATAASRLSRGRQTKGKAYCGRACRDFPHGMTS